MIVDVQCEDDTVQIANLIRDEDGYNVEVRFLVKVKNELYDFDDEISVIPKESITGWYDVEKLEDTHLYVKVHGGYELIDDSEDEDYTCSEEDDESESESLVDEDDEA
jgi:hypothetical protein